MLLSAPPPSPPPRLLLLLLLGLLLSLAAVGAAAGGASAQITPSQTAFAKHAAAAPAGSGSGGIRTGGGGAAVGRRWAAVGASGGCVDVFCRRGGAAAPWAHHRRLCDVEQRISVPPSGSRFGRSVALAELGGSGGAGLGVVRLVVGAPGEASCSSSLGRGSDVGCVDAGAVMVFELDEAAPPPVSDQWQEVAYLKAGNIQAGYEFGFAVAVRGDRLMVGMPGDASTSNVINSGEFTSARPDSGSAHIYERQPNGVWTRTAYLKSSYADGNGDERSGASVALGDDLAAMGMPMEDSGFDGFNPVGNNHVAGAGAVTVFSVAAGTWSQSVFIKHPASDGNDYFGTSVAMWRDVLVVGAPSDDSCATGVDGDFSDNSCGNSGAALVYRRNESQPHGWQFEHYLKRSASAGVATFFGETVAVSEFAIAVGDPFAFPGGAVSLFERDAVTGDVVGAESVFAHNRDAADQLGFKAMALAQDGNMTLVAGAEREDSCAENVTYLEEAELAGQNNSCTDSGAVYFFDLACPSSVFGCPCGPGSTCGPGLYCNASLQVCTNTAPPASTGTTSTTTGGGLTTAGVISTTAGGSASSSSSSSPSSPPSPPPSSDDGVVQGGDEGPGGGDDLPIWLLAVIGAGACLLVLCIFGALVFLVRRRRSGGSSTSTSASDAAVASAVYHNPDLASCPTVAPDEVEEELIYDAITVVMSGVKGGEDNYVPFAHMVSSSEQVYARVPHGAVVEGTYHKIPSRLQALGNDVQILSVDDVLVDASASGRLGKGQFGMVMRGLYHGEPVAVKALHGEISDETLQEVYDEASIVARLPRHPNVIGVIGCTPDPLLIVLEFASNGSLLGFCRRVGRELSVEQRTRIVRDVANGMAFLAEHKIVHRDLAARNTLLGDSLEPKICDFGMSKLTEAGEYASHSKNAAGPVLWMAPESLRKGAFSEASDVWSWGILAWEVATHGRRPYSGNDAEEGKALKKESATEAVRGVLKHGRRMTFPADVLDDSVVELVTQGGVWSAEPTQRPTFATICDAIDDGGEGEDIVYHSIRSVLATHGGDLA